MEKEYQEMMSTVVKEYGSLIGIKTAVKKASKMPVEIGENGEVSKYTGDPMKILEDIVKEYAALSGDVAIKFCKKSSVPILKKYPNLQIPSILK